MTGTELNPYTLGLLLGRLGYDRADINHNGWQMDYWHEYTKDGYKNLCVNGTGIMFELFLRQS